MIDAYKQAFECVQHAEPTCVSPVINHVAKLAAQVAEEPNSQVYPINNNNIIINLSHAVDTQCKPIMINIRLLLLLKCPIISICCYIL